MATSALRYRRLIQELPKHKHAKDALIASGFAKSTAEHKAKRALTSALKHQAKEILTNEGIDNKTSKRLMTDLLGVSSGELFNRLKWLAFDNNRDVATGYKILQSLAKEHGMTLSSEEDKTITVPILNLSFGQNMAKNIEPTKDNEVIESKEIKDIEDKP